MANIMAFGEVLEAADLLSLSEKETLLEVLQKRIVEERRMEIAKEVEDANREHEAGQTEPVSADELIRELSL